MVMRQGRIERGMEERGQDPQFLYWVHPATSSPPTSPTSEESHILSIALSLWNSLSHSGHWEPLKIKPLHLVKDTKPVYDRPVRG